MARDSGQRKLDLEEKKKYLKSLEKEMSFYKNEIKEKEIEIEGQRK